MSKEPSDTFLAKLSNFLEMVGDDIYLIKAHKHSTTELLTLKVDPSKLRHVLSQWQLFTAFGIYLQPIINCQLVPVDGQYRAKIETS